jgi:hypothetical protein
MKFIELSNLSKKQIKDTLKQVAGVSFTLSTKFVKEEKWNLFNNILPVILAAGFTEKEQDIGHFGTTKFFSKK